VSRSSSPPPPPERKPLQRSQAVGMGESGRRRRQVLTGADPREAATRLKILVCKWLCDGG
jgi:hypothetical protein